MNRKGFAVGLILLLIGTSVISTTAQDVEKSSQATSRGNWLYVGGSGPGNYTKIQDAIDNASVGDTVFVFNGTYYGPLHVTRALTLIGEDKHTTIIDGEGTQCILTLEGSEINVTGFLFQHSSNWSIFVGGSFCIITDNIFTNIGQFDTYGPKCVIYIYFGANNTVSYNVFKNNKASGVNIHGSSSHHNRILGNIFENNSYYGITTVSSSNDTISNNIFNNNTGGGILLSSIATLITDNIFVRNGIVLSSWTGNIYPWAWINTYTFENNSINGKPIRYYSNVSNIVVPLDTGQVILANCSNCTIQNLNLSEASIGIQLLYSSYNKISENTISYNKWHGILLAYSNNNIVSHNTIKNNYDGIHLSTTCELNTISENILENNTCGINLSDIPDYDNPHIMGFFVGDNPHINSKYISSYNSKPFIPLFKRNIIKKNNFFENRDHGFFNSNFLISAFWRQNYWGMSRILPYPVFGRYHGGLNWVNFDWRPAKEPYVIPEMN